MSICCSPGRTQRGNAQASSTWSWDGVAQSVKLITRDASERVLRFAFRYADETGRKRLRVLHKGTIMKMSDGLFASTAAEVSREYP